MSDTVEIVEDVVIVSVDDSHVDVVTIGTQGPAGPQGDPATSLVTSVAGRQGDVTLSSADVGLGNVDNTHDLDKPISTATQTALNATLSNPMTTAGDLILGGASGAPTRLPSSGTANRMLVTTTTNGVPSWSSATVAMGGTGRTSATSFALIAGGTSSTAVLQSVSNATAGMFLKSAGSAALPLMANIVESDVANLVTDLAAKQAASAIAANGMGVIVHGSTASTARVSGFAGITWIGSVQPTNALTNDVWVYKP